MTSQVRIGFLGVGSAIRTPYRNVGTLLDDQLLVDVPPGTGHALATLDTEPDAIEGIVITHLHGDHIFGLPLFLTEFLARRREKSLPVLGPLGLEEVTRKLLTLAWPDVPADVILQAADVSFECLSPWCPHQMGGWQVTPVPVAHGSLPAYGMRLERDAHRIFHTGDSALCATVLQECAAASLVIADIASVVRRGLSHMSVEDIVDIRAVAPDTPVMAIHRDFPGTDDGLTLFPCDGDIYIHSAGASPTKAP